MESSGRGLHVIGDQLETVLREQVVVGWLDKTMGRRRYLGQLCGSDKGKASLTLHVRQDAAIQQRVLINIHVPVKIHSSTSERPRDMYLVVPAEQLSMSEGMRKDTDHVHPYIGRDYLEVRCRLNAPAFVVMPVPRRKLQKPVTGIPAEILSCLEMLSETKDLELYLADSESVRRCLLDIGSTLQKESAKMTTPAIDYRLTYANGWRAAANCWNEYPRDGASSSCWNPLVEDAPPPYDNVVPSPPPHKEKLPVVSPGPAGGGTESLESPIESSIFKSTLGNLVESARKRKAHDALSDHSDEVRLRDNPFDPELTPTQVFPTPEVAQRYWGGSDAALSPTEVFPTPLNIHTRERQPEVRDESKSDSDAAVSLDKSSAESLEQRLHAAAATPSPCSIVPNSFPPPSPLHSPSPRTMVSPIVTSAFPDIQPPADTVPCPPAPPLNSTSPSATTTTPKPEDLFQDLIQLVCHTSTLLAKVHDDFLPQLLRLGRFAREGDAAAFNVSRDAFMWTVIRRCAASAVAADDDAPRTTYSWTDKVEVHAEYVRRWMNDRVCRYADLYVLHDLVELQAAAMRVREVQKDGPAKEWAKQLFERQRAACFAGVFYLFGGRI